MKSLILVGGGGHCKSVIEAAESAGYHILGVLDMPDLVGQEILSSKIIGTDEDIPKYVDQAEFVITVGFIKNPSTRIKLYKQIKEAGGKFATIIASTAYVSRYASIGEGTVIMHHTFVGSGAKVGNNVIVNTLSNISHDAIVGDQCHISTGALVNGECVIGNNVFIGSQAVLANDVSIADDIIVGAASFVRKSLKEKGIYSGNPAILKIKAK